MLPTVTKLFAVLALLSEFVLIDRTCFAQSAKQGSANQDWQAAGTIDGYNTHILALAFGPRSILVSGDAEFVRVWDVETKHEHPFFKPPIKYRRPITGITYSPNDKWVSIRGMHEYHLATESNKGMKDGLPIDAGNGAGPSDDIRPLAIAPDGKTYAIGSFRQQNHSVDLIQHEFGTRRNQSGQRISCRGHQAEPTCAAFSPDLKYVVTGGDDKTARLWDTSNGKELAVFVGHTDGVAAIEFSPNGEWIATGGKDGHVKLWNAATRTEQTSLPGKTAIRCLTFSPDGKSIATGDEEGLLRIWNVKDAKSKAVLTDHTGTIFALAFRRDGKLLASAGQDKIIRFWKERSAN